MDEGSYPLNARIKLEIPFSKTNVHKSHKDALVTSFNKYQFKIIEGPASIIEEIGCIKFVDIHFEISHVNYARNLLLAIQEYLAELNKAGLPHHYKGTLSIFSIECFERRLITAEIRKPVSAIMFGNIQSGVFISHWEVSFDEKCLRTENNMFADFEFDRADMIVVSFKTVEKSRDRKNHSNKTITRNAEYKIVVQRAFIRRIIVDNAVCDSYGSNRIRLFFELNCPPFIKRAEERVNSKFDNPRFDRKTNIKRGRYSDEFSKDSAIADSSFFAIEFGLSMTIDRFYPIISRLRTRCSTPIEFMSLPIINCFIGSSSPYFTWIEDYDYRKMMCDQDVYYNDFLNKNFPSNYLMSADLQKENKRKKFVIRYLVECLLSRGALVKDQLCLSDFHWRHFLNVLSSHIEKDFNIAEVALERLVTLLDERKRIGCISKCLENLFRECEIAKLEGKHLAQQEAKEGYNRVRKVIFTPTRTIYVVPEMLMSNRVIRSFDKDGTRVLRIQFRDDDNQKMRQNKTSKLLIEQTVQNRLLNGIVVGGQEFGYLGSSNSQMRDNGAYFCLKNRKIDIKEYKEEFGEEPKESLYIKRVRKELGRFEKVESVPKYMARLGQCFTQSRDSKVKLERACYGQTYDIIGGSAPVTLKEYTFSDGVGMISISYAQRIATDFNGSTNGFPSCFQFRYRGMKGVLAVNPFLDEMAKWAEENGIEKPAEDDAASSIRTWKLHCAVRESQIKFTGPHQDNIEIVKPSAPVPVALNKPFINILDQVSEMQSAESHNRIVNRIQFLLDKQIRSFASALIVEQDCRTKLKELPRRIDIDCLHQRAGFSLCSEPFFRSLVKSATKFAITKQLRKEQIQIPYELGRSMLGIIDETGRLQYGQIFVQYSKNIQEKYPTRNAPKSILTGRVLITKNPCNVAGDVRVFNAVDIEELRHLVDVIVFPQHGPRPHPDEMAGSDLDGDEYSVIWDQELLLDGNEPPFDYSSENKRVEKLKEETLDAKMVEFYLNYMLQDSVGVISNNFLHQSVLYGINSTVCLNLAKKISMAVDFTKSGTPPPPLTKDWSYDERTKEEIPPESADIIPDYHVSENGNKPVYVCPRLIGRLYRDIKAIEDVLRISEDRDERMDIEIDEYLDFDGWEEYRITAARQLAKYNNLLRTVMENYGIQTEAEAFSGYICELRNRISDKDQDDMSFFNTNLLIETKITTIFKAFREEFFEEFGGWKECTEKNEKTFADEENICHRECKNPSSQIKQKAVAYYRVCYETATRTREKKLSFAWVAYDVLANVRLEQALKGNELTVTHPLYDKLSEHNKRYINENQTDFLNFSQFQDEDLPEAREILQKYCTRYQGLDVIFFVLSNWGKTCSVLNEQFRELHLCLLFLLHATGYLSSVNGDGKVAFEQIPLDLDLETIKNDANKHENITNSAELLVRFFELLASRMFTQMSTLSFDHLGLDACFIRGEWLSLSKSALKTYYNLVFNLRFDELPCQGDVRDISDAIIRECEPFCIQLPEKIPCSDIELVEKKLFSKSKVHEVVLRKVVGTEGNRYMVSARGTLESLDRLKELVAVKPQIKCDWKGKEVIKELTKLVYKKIIC